MTIEEFNAGIAERNFIGDVTSSSQCYNEEKSLYLLHTDGLVILTNKMYDEIGCWYFDEFIFSELDRYLL